ncbi:hypothetical protein LTR36_010980 [Oleoguttula mirabilis]|uniref:Uncharacterized protein n=1 Tax=Oleoguttula mirabilis TaxID=1507867 RepID=A0AAV9J3C0_9PEZI|nr:hypothetical protein LTR36_010980 [Oleoguttula mirabilis]
MASALEEPIEEPYAYDFQGPFETLIWPRQKMTVEQIVETEAAIRAIAGPSVAVENYTSSFDGLRFWFCFLDEAQEEAVSKLDGVFRVEKDGFDPDLTPG